MLPVPASGQETAHVSRGYGQANDDLGAAPVSSLRDGGVDETEVAVVHHSRLGGAGAGAAAVAEVRPPQALRHRIHGSQHRRLDQQKDGRVPRGERALRA